MSDQPIRGLDPRDCQHAREPADIAPPVKGVEVFFNFCPYCGRKLEVLDQEPDLESCIIPGRRCED